MRSGHRARQEVSSATLTTKITEADDLDVEEREFCTELAHGERGQKIAFDVKLLSEDARRDYLLFRFLSNAYAHPSETSLRRHVTIDPETSTRLFNPEPACTGDDLYMTVLHGVVPMLDMMANLSQIVLGKSWDERRDHLSRELEGLRKSGL